MDFSIYPCLFILSKDTCNEIKRQQSKLIEESTLDSGTHYNKIHSPVFKAESECFRDPIGQYPCALLILIFSLSARLNVQFTKVSSCAKNCSWGKQPEEVKTKQSQCTVQQSWKNFVMWEILIGSKGTKVNCITADSNVTEKVEC